MHFTFLAVIVVIVAALIFYAGMRYGCKMESDAYQRLAALRQSLARAGLDIDTALTGDVARIYAAAKLEYERISSKVSSTVSRL